MSVEHIDEDAVRLAAGRCSYLAPRSYRGQRDCARIFPTMLVTAIPAFSELARLATPIMGYGLPKDIAGVAIYLVSKARNFVCCGDFG